MYDIEPKDMPAFLNDLAHIYFKNNDEIREKLAQCSIYIHFVNYKSNSDRSALIEKGRKKDEIL